MNPDGSKSRATDTKQPTVGTTETFQEKPPMVSGASPPSLSHMTSVFWHFPSINIKMVAGARAEAERGGRAGADAQLAVSA